MHMKPTAKQIFGVTYIKCTQAMQTGQLVYGSKLNVKRKEVIKLVAK